MSLAGIILLLKGDLTDGLLVMIFVAIIENKTKNIEIYLYY